MGIVVRQSLKGTFVNYVGVVFGAFIQFYCVAAWLDKPVQGLLKVVYEAAALLSVLALMGSGSAGMRFFPLFKDKATGNHGFFYYYLLFPAIGLPLMTVLYVLLQEPILDYFNEKSPQFNEYFYYVLPLMVVLTFWQWWESFANIHLRIAIPKAIREIGMRVMMVGIYFSFYRGWIDVSGMIFAFIAAYGVCMLSTGIYSCHIGCTELKHDWKFVTPDLKQKVCRYSGFLMIATISGNIMNQLDLWMLTGVRGLYAAGIYTMAGYMAEVVNMPARNITPISNPLAAEAMKNGDIAKARDLYSQVSVHQMLASAVLLLLIWINIDNIFEILPRRADGGYEAGKWAVLYLGLSKVIYSTLNFGNTLISFSKYYYWTLVVTVILTGLTICTNLLFIDGCHRDLYLFTLDIPALGLTGAALATLLTCFLSYCYQQFIVQVMIKANPFTWAHLRILILVAVLFGINHLVPDLSEVSPCLDLVVRSAVYVVVGTVLVYHLKISPQVESFLGKYLHRK